ncbi:26460_t:CDS:2, partial [Racocetra persica]
LFPECFTNLLNLYMNIYLLQHAQNFAMLTNIAVGVKEMLAKPQFNVNTNMLSSLVTDSYLNTMFSNWYATSNASLTSIILQNKKNKEDAGYAICHDKYFTDIKLKNR